ncbi:uncharacterized protein LOC144624727 [Crassostrea virginica]
MYAQQLKAVSIVQGGHSLYIGGQAGVGKSYLVQQIFEDARRRHKSVQLTCTTGIACSNYPQVMNAMTIHRCSGIGDGRYTGQKLQQLVCHDDQCAGAKERIISTEMLIIDEISMMSRHMLDKLETVCRIRNISAAFGGIQLIVVGDFLQLPPVKNTRYGDLGEYAFTSSYWPNHSVFLDKVVRQDNETLIKCIRSLSLGEVNFEDNYFIHSLSRPLLTNHDIVYLFATNVLVDMFNRDGVLSMEGNLYTLDAVDSGEEKHLNTLVVQKVLWLKIKSNVMLHRNISDKLVNGLCVK